MARDIADTASTVLLVVGVAALLAPALFPVQQVLYHQVGAGTAANGSQLEAEGYTVVAYENLSERGQAIYVDALDSAEREYTVPAGMGAPEFPYDAGSEPGEIVIERPDDAELPPPAEPVDRLGNERERLAERSASQNATGSESPSERARTLEQRREVIATYDLVTVRQESPPLTHPANLLRLGAVALGTVALGVGGYLRSRP